MKLTDKELAVLKVLAEAYAASDDRCYMPFAPIMEATGLDRATVRRACRSLARKGLARFLAGLWTDDGEPGGAGYAATDEGAKAYDEMTEDDDAQ